MRVTRSTTQSATISSPHSYNIDDGLKELIRATVIKGLNSSSRKRTDYQAKIQLTCIQSDALKRAFGLGYTLKNCSIFMEEFRIIRANFSTFHHFSKIKDDSFKIAIRNSRVVHYNCHGNNELKTKSIQPPPYMVISFKRSEGRLNINDD